MNKIPSDGMRIRNERTGEEFTILPVKDVQQESTTTKILAVLFVGLMLTLATSVLCRITRKLFT